MHGFKENIEKLTLENDNFRKVLYTAKYSQLVLMSLRPHQEIGMEVHKENDQFFRFEQGTGKVIIDGNEINVESGDAVIIPAGANHNIINLSPSESLKMYSMYSPAHHRDGVVHVTKEDAQNDNEKFDGRLTE